MDEALGVTPSRGKAGNLHEARALQMGRAAAARGTKGQEISREDETFTWIEPPTKD